MKENDRTVRLEGDRRWIELYAPGIEPTLKPACGTALDLFRTAVRERPHHAAIWHAGRELTYTALDLASDALAIRLIEAGVTRFDRVALAFQNTPEFPTIVLAVWKIGAIPVPVNPLYSTRELARIFADAEPSAVLGEAACSETLARAVAEAGLASCAVLSASPDSATEIRTAIGGSVTAPETPQRFTQSDPAPADVGLLLYTSGTTGDPKGAMLRHSGLAFNGEMFAHWCALDGNSRVLAIAPFFHITGFVCHMLAALSARATLITYGRFEPGVVLDVIRGTRPTSTIGAITAFNALLNAPEALPDDFSSFERVYSGGAPIPKALVEQF